MRTEGLISKVAICPLCRSVLYACHVDYLDKNAEKQFTEFTNEGFIVKVESKDETLNRKFGAYHICKYKKCVTKTKTI